MSFIFRSSLLVALAAVVACAGNDPGPGGGPSPGPSDTTADSGPRGDDREPDDGPLSPDGGPDDVRPDAGPATGRAPGSACDCDAECAGTTTHPGLCVQGVCMTRATSACAEAGSSSECPTPLAARRALRSLTASSPPASIADDG
ncbi:MAG: hypothetical protein KF901_25570 [Myxococcales bacterium]|nr:hypothetical protein [Myxococcales bacterium]